MKKENYHWRLIINMSFLLVTVLLSSCASTKRFQKSLENRPVPLGYFFDSEIKECDKSAQVAISQFDDTALIPVTTADKKSEFIIPLLFFNYWEVNFNTTLGKSSLEQDYSTFFQKSLAIESERSGCFTSNSDTIEADYTLEINFDECNVTSRYKRNSTVFIIDNFESVVENEKCFPTVSHFKFTAVLKKNGKNLFEKTYLTNSKLPFYSEGPLSIDELRTAYLNNMGISMSQTTKQSIEELVDDISIIIESDRISIPDKSLLIPDASTNKIIIMP